MNVTSHNNRSRHNANQHYRRRSANNNHSKKNNSSSTPAVLSGVIACLSGLDFDHKEELHAIITQLGGEYSGALDAGCGITHLVLDEPEGSVKYRFVQQILADEGKGDDDMMKKWAKELKIVTSGWVEACAREGRRVDEGRFTLHSSQQEQHHLDHNKHLSRSIGDNNCIDDIANSETKQNSSSMLSLPKEIPQNATLEEACEWFIQQQQQNDPYGLQQRQIFSMHSFLLVGFHSTVPNVDSKANHEGGDNTNNNNDSNHQKHRRLHAKLSTLVRNAGGTIYWEPNELTTIVLVNDDVDNIDYDDYNQQQLHHRHQERLLTFQEAKAYCQYHPRGPVAVTPRWILACIHHGAILDFPSSFPSPPPIPIPPMLPVPSKKKSSAVVDFAADDVNKNGKDVKPALYSTTKDTSIDKPKRKYKQSTIFQGDIFVVIRPQQLPSSLSASLEYTQDEMESKITNAGGLILSKRILEAMKKDVVRKQQEHAIQQRRRKNNDNNDIATTENSDEKRRYYVVSSGGHSNLHHSKYHPLLGDLSKILQQSLQLGSAGSTDLSSIIEPVSPIWITSCIQEGYVYNPIQYPKLFQPQTYHLRLFPKDTKFLVSVTGFVDASRYGIIWMLRSLGAEYTDSLKAKNTHLICCRTVNDENNNRNIVGGGPKYTKAKEWGLHVVTVDWLYHCMRYGYEEGCEEQFLATRLEDQPKNNVKKEEKKSSEVSVRCSMDTINITNKTDLTDPVVSKTITEATAVTETIEATTATATMEPPSKSDNNTNTLSKSDDESSSPRRGKRDRKLPQASPIDNDSGKRFKSALQTLQSTPTVGTATSSSSSRRRRGKRDRSPRTNNSQGSQRGENDGGGGSPSLLSQQSQESEYPQAETQFTIRADADIGKHWADSSGFDDDEAPLSQVNEAEDNGESQVVWLPFMRR